MCDTKKTLYKYSSFTITIQQPQKLYKYILINRGGGWDVFVDSRIWIRPGDYVDTFPSINPVICLYIQGFSTATRSVVCILAKEMSISHCQPCFLFMFGFVHLESSKVVSWTFSWEILTFDLKYQSIKLNWQVTNFTINIGQASSVWGQAFLI